MGKNMPKDKGPHPKRISLQDFAVLRVPVAGSTGTNPKF